MSHGPHHPRDCQCPACEQAANIFFGGFDKQSLPIDPIGPTKELSAELAAAKSRIGVLDDTLEYNNRIRREAEEMADGYAAEVKRLNARIGDLEQERGAEGTNWFPESFVSQLQAQIAAVTQNGELLAKELSDMRDKVRKLDHQLATVTQAFKNFHNNLCKRFDYGHDEIDWQRDQASLEEHIARRIQELTRQRNEQIVAARELAKAATNMDEQLAAVTQERDTLKEKLNTPELLSFRDAVVLEAAHQRERWGSEHDDGKQPSDWFWLIGYLAGKALAAHSAHVMIGADPKKALHHTISTAAALANWHAAILGKTSMRPGIMKPADAALTEEENPA